MRNWPRASPWVLCINSPPRNPVAEMAQPLPSFSKGGVGVVCQYCHNLLKKIGLVIVYKPPLPLLWKRRGLGCARLPYTPTPLLWKRRGEKRLGLWKRRGVAGRSSAWPYTPKAFGFFVRSGRIFVRSGRTKIRSLRIFSDDFPLHAFRRIRLLPFWGVKAWGVKQEGRKPLPSSKSCCRNGAAPPLLEIRRAVRLKKTESVAI